LLSFVVRNFTQEDALATHILPFTPDPDDDDEPFAAERHSYTFGGCGLFAGALNRITGWPMVAYDTCQDLFAHMGVQAPDGAIWDARGRHEQIETFIAPFGSIVPKRGLRIVTLEDLIAYAPNARLWPYGLTERVASMMFPDLPHLPTSDRSRNVAFMDAVETISRQHNVWIVANNRDAIHLWPVIGDEFDEITGYMVLRGEETLVFDRALQSDRVTPIERPRDVVRFIEALTEVSREHKLWIRAGFPTARPRLFRLADAALPNAHYALYQTSNGGGFLVSLC
jgi:hypothetical protein